MTTTYQPIRTPSGTILPMNPSLFVTDRGACTMPATYRAASSRTREYDDFATQAAAQHWLDMIAAHEDWVETSKRDRGSVVPQVIVNELYR